MKKYKEINWSEVARRAIIGKLLALKSSSEGIAREEFEMLLEASGIRVTVRYYGYEREMSFWRKSKGGKGGGLEV